jgi:hypothetical protein
MKLPKNKITTPKALSFFIILVAISAIAAGTTTLYQSNATVGFKLIKDLGSGIRSVIKSSQDYELYRKFTDEGGDELFLVSSNTKIQYPLDAEGIAGTTSWTVRHGDRLDTVLWSKTEQSSQLNVNHNLGVLVTGLDGCCGSMTGYRLYDIPSGTLLMSFNNFNEIEKVIQPFSIEVPNSKLKTRFMGVISNDSTRDRDFVEPVAGKQAVALIKYASDALKQKFQIDIETAEGYAPSILYVTMERDPAVPKNQEIEINNGIQAVLWNINNSENAADISGVMLKIVMDAGFGEKTVKIPVRQDELKLEFAEFPPGVELRLL